MLLPLPPYLGFSLSGLGKNFFTVYIFVVILQL